MAASRNSLGIARGGGVLSTLIRARVLLVVAALLAASSAFSETGHAPYSLQIAHETVNDTACVLLQQNGAFHYESGDRNNTRVYEGELTAAQLGAAEARVQTLSAISQDQIEEPLLHGPRDLLDIHFFQNGDVKELLFRSGESQEPFKTRLKPLLQWMDGLRKLPHRELSEDAGKNNCLPRRELVLKRRDEVISQPPLVRAPLAGRRISPPPAPPVAPPGVTPLVRLELLERNSSGALQRCALVASDGRYHFELRTQRTGRKDVENRIALGQITAEEMQRLEKILDAPALATIRHHEPPDTMPLNIIGSVLELSIVRASEVQELVLTDTQHRNTFFYAGDGDISRAKALLQFVQENVEREKLRVTSSSELNGCSETQ
jgi:hypothetical protein